MLAFVTSRNIQPTFLDTYTLCWTNIVIADVYCMGVKLGLSQ